MALAAVIACGGASRRMGRDKATLEIGGERLLDRVVRRVAEAADPVLIAPGRTGRLGPLPWPEVDDAMPDAGPASGLVAALGRSPHRLMAAVAVDLPYADPAVLRELASQWNGQVAVVPVVAGRAQWLHAVWAAEAHQELERRLQAGARSFVELTDGLAIARTHPPDGRFALNLNHPEDLAALDSST